jgi:hypothetical protein
LLDGKITKGISYGLSSMASGVDLWFCQACLDLEIPYAFCIPFEDHKLTMSPAELEERNQLIQNASAEHVANRWMVKKGDVGLVVWDANRGETHNVVQQLVEAKKPFWWINPVSEAVWRCF